MPLSSSSDSDGDGDDDREMLRRILAKTGTSAMEIPNDSDSDSSGSDVLGWFRQIQEKFSINSDGPDPFPVIKPLRSVAPSDSDDDDVMETMAAIHRRFDQYENDVMKDQDQIVMQETNTTVTDITSQQEITDILSKDLNCTHQLRNSSFTGLHQLVDISGDVPMKALTYSQFPKSAQNFVSALKKNRSCQRFIRRKLIEIEAKIEESKRLKERIKCLMDFQLSCKRKIGHIICQKKDPRVRLISMQKQRTSKAMKGESATKIPALCHGPPENSHVSKYKMVLKRFPLPFKKQHWSVVEKENLAKGLKQQYQEMLLLNSMNLESDLESSMNPDMMSAILSNDLEVTSEKIRSFLPLVNWDRLASMYVSGRSGLECESRWLNCEDPLINYSPWTILEDKKLLLIVQERGIYNWIDIAVMLGTRRTPFQCLARYQRSLNPHILNKNWTEDEDFMLRTAVEIFGEHNWQLVASNLEGRTGTQCSNRWLKTLNPERRKVGRWSVDEDKRLKVAVMLFGAKNWKKIARFAPGRTQVQCRERWLNCLDPSLKLEAWTTEEDDKLKAAIDEHGYSWSKVATCVPPRTDNQCMRRWKYLFPEEVSLLREARRLKKTVLISNFVDRESERPLIGPGDFSSLVSTPAECGNSSKGSKKRSREGAEREKQREVSRNKKSKKSRAKSRRCSEENMSGNNSLNSGEAPFTD
ncbi:myb-like protein L, partial [Asparagus officinalis]